ncbi:MAG: DNA topoisomerase, partial [Clostridiales bacterium]|nr:DNA topoisomerase [Clostridiales bacterium]
LENAKAEVIIEKTVEEREVFFVMDRFGYGKILEKNIYERNQETVEAEYRMIVPCRNTDKLRIFTQNGQMHQLNVQDIPGGRLREKGVPIDNLCNYDSRDEQILFILSDWELAAKQLLFVTASSLVKLVEGTEFLVQKKTVTATKLAEDDRLVAVFAVDAEKDIEKKYLVLQSEGGYFLRFPMAQITKKKKNALGIRGMSLKDDDRISHAYLTEAAADDFIMYKDKELFFQKIKLMSRDNKGVKVRR